MASNNYSKQLLLQALAAACLCLPNLWAQGSPPPVIAEPTQRLVAKRGTAVESKISVSVPPGFHVNSNTPSDSYLIPLKLSWTPGALEAGAVTFPKPQMEKYEFSDKPLSVFTGNFDLTAKFNTPATAPQGQGMMVGKLRYQACNNNSCFPPKTVEVHLLYTIK